MFTKSTFERENSRVNVLKNETYMHTEEIVQMSFEPKCREK